MATIASKFSRGTEGWSISGDAAVFEQRATGGHPDGYLYWEDAATGSDAFWIAPAKFLGDLSAYRGGRLSYDAYSSADNYETGDVYITGNGMTLVADVAEPGTGWTSVSVLLSPKGKWHVDSLDGALATKSQIAAVLADVTAIQIRAEHVSGNEFGGLDTVMLKSKPAPAAAFGDDTPMFADAGAHHAPSHPHDLA